MGLITKPYTFIAGATKTGEAAQVNADYDALYNEFNGNITDANINALATIQQSKILNLVADLNTIRATKGGQISLQLFAGSTTYAKPSNLLFAIIIAVGSGGGGGGPATATATRRTAGGGGGGSTAIGCFNNSQILPVETITINPHGAGGGLLGGTGGAATFGGLLFANGGSGGGYSGADDQEGPPGQGGTASTGQILVAGSDGYVGTAALGAHTGGHGGASMFGGGGLGAYPGQTPFVGRRYGGGGGGGISASGSASAGADGADGVVIVIEFKA